MHRFQRLIILFVLTTLTLAPFGQQLLASQERINYESLRVGKIVVEEDGGVSAQTRSLFNTMKTKEGEYFSQREFDEDLKLLASDFAQVVPKLIVKDNMVMITLSLSKRPTIQSITFVGNKEIETDKLQKELGIAQKGMYDRQTFLKALNKLRAYYIKKGYFESKITFEQQSTAPGQVDLVINVQEGHGGKIDEIRFINFTNAEQDLLDERLMTKEYTWWISWLNDTGYYNKEKAQQDELGVLTLLQNEGYADATVETKILSHETKPERIVVEIICNRGDLYTISNITVTGNTLFPPDEILSKIAIKSGSPYSPDELRRASRDIYDLYGKHGYIDALITPEGKLDRSARSYEMNFSIKEGGKFRVGMIKIFGNTRTDSSVILHESPLVPGEVFDTTLLRKAEERLQNVGFFKSVNIYAVRTSTVSAPDAQFRDVHIEVDEKPTTANFTAFAGYSTTEKLVGGVGFNETNFRIAGIPRMFRDGMRAVRGAGEYFGLNAQVGTRQLQYNATWTKPYFMDTKWIVGVDLQKMRNSYAVSDYTIRTQTATVTANYPVNAFVKVGSHYRIRNSDIDLKGIHHTDRNRQLIRESKNGGLISAVGVNWSYDSTNHPLLPTAGIRSTASLEYAGLGGDHRFLNFGYVNTLFWSPSTHGTFRFRGNVHCIQTLFGTHPRRLPLDERLYLGGEQSMRGFRYNTVGPRFHDVKHTPRGGTSSILMSAEYDLPLMKRLSVFAFADVGNVYFSQFSLGYLQYTAGCGFKVKITETAPLIFGFGFPIDPRHKEDVQRFFFSIGTAF